MRRKRALVLGAAGLVVLAAAAVITVVALAKPFVQPNVLLITLDTVRADHCSVYGYRRPTTPAMEQVAREGVLMLAAYAPTALTGPSHATMFTALYPQTHGFVRNGNQLDSKARTLAEVLAEAGYQTAAVVSAMPVHRRFGLDQGFELYEDDLGRRLERDARETVDLAVRWLRGERRAEQPFFLWVHLFDPHSPYLPPMRYRELFPEAKRISETVSMLDLTIARYDAEIRETDDAIASLLQVLDEEQLSPSTLLVIAGDHGEGLMQHSIMEHGLEIYEEAIRVPLLLRWPDQLPAKAQVSEPVQLLDLTPTVLDLVRVPYEPSAVQGISLARALTGDEHLDPEREVYLQRRFLGTGMVQGFEIKGEKLGLRKGSWKYIEARGEGTYELYNLARDPAETSNLYSKQPEVSQELATLLRTWYESTPSGTGEEQEIGEEDREKLRALGYTE